MHVIANSIEQAIARTEACFEEQRKLITQTHPSRRAYQMKPLDHVLKCPSRPHTLSALTLQGTQSQCISRNKYPHPHYRCGLQGRGGTRKRRWDLSSPDSKRFGRLKHRRCQLKWVEACQPNAPAASSQRACLPSRYRAFLAAMTDSHVRNPDGAERARGALAMSYGGRLSARDP